MGMGLVTTCRRGLCRPLSGLLVLAPSVLLVVVSTSMDVLVSTLMLVVDSCGAWTGAEAGGRGRSTSIWSSTSLSLL
jgi:hypothetical protein